MDSAPVAEPENQDIVAELHAWAPVDPVLSCTVPLTPIPKSVNWDPRSGRPYLAKTSRVYQQRLSTWIRKNCAFDTHKGPVRCEFSFIMPRPKRLAKAGAWRHPHIVRPDADNLVKSTLDGVQAARVLDDDKQVVELVAKKEYAALDEDPHVGIHIVPMEEPVREQVDWASDVVGELDRLRWRVSLGHASANEVVAFLDHIRGSIAVA